MSEADEVLYHITHDVRASMRALKTLPVWLRDDLAETGVPLSASALETMEMLETHANRVDQMMSDLLVHNRIGRLSDEPSVVELADLINGLCATVPVPASFKVTADMEVDALFGPRNDITSIFSALLSNAVKHHHKGAGHIHFWSRNGPQGVTFRVVDDGPGVAEKFRERVFAMMTTLRPRDEVEGSGLGLAIARKALKLMGGEVSLIDPP
ncbi:MAG: sensor histidine kinase, partial [Pseudomonadota bacterium]